MYPPEQNKPLKRANFAPNESRKELIRINLLISSFLIILIPNFNFWNSYTLKVL